MGLEQIPFKRFEKHYLIESLYNFLFSQTTSSYFWWDPPLIMNLNPQIHLLPYFYTIRYNRSKIPWSNSIDTLATRRCFQRDWFPCQHSFNSIMSTCKEIGRSFYRLEMAPYGMIPFGLSPKWLWWFEVGPKQDVTFQVADEISQIRNS